MCRGAIRLTLAAAIALGASAVSARGQDALHLTLEEVRARADEQSHRLAALRAREESAAAAEAARRAGRLPLVAANGGYMRTNHVDEFALSLPGQPLRVLYPDVPDNYRARLDLQWPIYTGGRLEALERAAVAERTAAGFDVAAARADLRLEATRAFFALVSARHTEQVVRRAIGSADAHLSELRSRLDQGLIPPNEVRSAEAQRTHQVLLSIEAANLRAIAEADLRRVMGEPSSRPVEPVATLEHQPTTDAVRRRAGLRPEQQAMTTRIVAAREREAAVDASGKPQLSAAAGYEYARPNLRIFPKTDEWRDSWDVALNVTWAVWDGGRRRAETAQAVADTRALVARSADMARDFAFEAEERRLQLESAEAAIPAADEGVRAAAEARRVLGERFAAGVATTAEVLDAEMVLLRAELDRTRALANVHLAAARLERALGR